MKTLKIALIVIFILQINLCYCSIIDQSKLANSSLFKDEIPDPSGEGEAEQDILNTPKKPTNPDMSDMPAYYLLETLGLLEIEENDKIKVIFTKQDDEKELTVKRITVRERNDRSKRPSGIDILLSEMFNLTNACESKHKLKEYKKVDLLYNNEGYLIAAIPVLDIYEDNELVKHQVCYFDFSFYNFAEPELTDPSAQAKWSVFMPKLMSDQQKIRMYLNSLTYPAIMRPANEDCPYVYVEFDKTRQICSVSGVYLNITGKIHIEQKKHSLEDIGSPGLFLDLSDDPNFVLPEVNDSKYQIILPRFPTIYAPIGINKDSDRSYLASLYHSIDKGDEVVLFGPATAYEAWIAAMRSQNPVWIDGVDAEDGINEGLNPIEVANARASAAIGKFTIKMAPKGKRFNVVLWNMPILKDRESPHSPYYTYPSFRAFWDNDYKGVVLRKFAKKLKSILKPDGMALLWNNSDRLVTRIIETAGEYTDAALPAPIIFDVKSTGQVYYVSFKEDQPEHRYAL